jgi:hypothetical protein
MMNPANSLICFSRVADHLYKVYDEDTDWCVVTQCDDGQRTERYFSKWSADINGSLTRAKVATSANAEWTMC